MEWLVVHPILGGAGMPGIFGSQIQQARYQRRPRVL